MMSNNPFINDAINIISNRDFTDQELREYRHMLDLKEIFNAAITYRRYNIISAICNGQNSIDEYTLAYLYVNIDLTKLKYFISFGPRYTTLFVILNIPRAFYKNIYILYRNMKLHDSNSNFADKYTSIKIIREALLDRISRHENDFYELPKMPICCSYNNLRVMFRFKYLYHTLFPELYFHLMKSSSMPISHTFYISAIRLIYKYTDIIQPYESELGVFRYMDKFLLKYCIRNQKYVLVHDMANAYSSAYDIKIMNESHILGTVDAFLLGKSTCTILCNDVSSRFICMYVKYTYSIHCLRKYLANRRILGG